MYIEGIPKPAVLDTDDFVSKQSLVKKILRLTQVMVDLPTKKDSGIMWADLVTGICTAAVHVDMPEELTLIDRMRSMIREKIDRFEADEKIDWHDEIERYIIVYNDNILFKPNTIMQMCIAERSEELKRLTRKEVNDLLINMGFELPAKHTSVKGKNFKVFKCPLKSFLS